MSNINYSDLKYKEKYIKYKIKYKTLKQTAEGGAGKKGIASRQITFWDYVRGRKLTEGTLQYGIIIIEHDSNEITTPAFINYIRDIILYKWTVSTDPEHPDVKIENYEKYVIGNVFYNKKQYNIDIVNTITANPRPGKSAVRTAIPFNHTNDMKMNYIYINNDSNEMVRQIYNPADNTHTEGSEILIQPINIEANIMKPEEILKISNNIFLKLKEYYNNNNTNIGKDTNNDIVCSEKNIIYYILFIEYSTEQTIKYIFKYTLDVSK